MQDCAFAKEEDIEKFSVWSYLQSFSMIQPHALQEMQPRKADEDIQNS